MKKIKDVSIKSFFNWSNEKKTGFVAFFQTLTDEEYEFVNCISVKKNKIVINDTYFRDDTAKVDRFNDFINSLTAQQKEYVCVFSILSPVACMTMGVKNR